VNEEASIGQSGKTRQAAGNSSSLLVIFRLRPENVMETANV
jgi:hypothetical protein